MIIEIANYQIRPYSNHLCWEIFRFREVKKRDGTKTEEWVSEERYPSDFESALSYVHERLLKDKNNNEVMSLEEALKIIENQSLSIKRTLKRLIPDLS